MTWEGRKNIYNNVACKICNEFLVDEEIPNKKRICSDCYYERNDIDQWDDFEWMDDRDYTDQSCNDYHVEEEEEVPFSFGRYVYVKKPYHHENDDEYSMFNSMCSYCGNSDDRCCCDMCNACDMIAQCCRCD